MKSLALLIALAAASPAQAAIFVFTGPLTGANEVPPNASPGTGSATITVDSDALTIRMQVVFSGVTSPATMAHIHIAPPGTNGPVATAMPAPAGFPLGATSGNFDATFDLTLASTYNPAFLNNAVNLGSTNQAALTLLAAHVAGNAYFNLHTGQFPGGELRANLVAVPEPATWAMMIAGFGATGMALRRRRPVPIAG